MKKLKKVKIMGCFLACMCLISFLGFQTIAAKANTGQNLKKVITFEDSYKISNVTSFYENFYITDKMDDLSVTMDLSIIMSDTAILDVSGITVYANEVPVSSHKFRDLSENANIKIKIDEQYFTKGNNSISVKAYVKSTEEDCEKNEDVNWALLKKGSEIFMEYKLQQVENIAEFYEGTYFFDNDGGKIMLAVPDEMTAFDYTMTATISALIGNHFKTDDYDVVIEIIPYSKAVEKEHSVLIPGTYEALKQAFPQVDFSFAAQGELSLEVRELEGVSHIFAIIDDEKQLKEFTGLFGDEALYGQLQSAEYVLDVEGLGKQPEDVLSKELEGRISEIGYEDSMTVGSGHQIFQYYIGIPGRDNMLKENTIQFSYVYSENLDFSDAYITVYINGEPVKTQVLTQEMAENDSIEFSIPDSLFDYSGFYITLDFNLSKTSPCESKVSEGSWVKVDAKSSTYHFKLQERNAFSLFSSMHFVQDNSGKVDGEILAGSLDEDVGNFANFCSYLGKRAFGVRLLKITKPESVPEGYCGLVLGTFQDRLLKSAEEGLKFQFTSDGKIASNDSFKQVNEELGIIQISEDTNLVLVAGSNTTQLNHALDYYTNSVNRYDTQIITMNDTSLAIFSQEPEERSQEEEIRETSLIIFLKENWSPILLASMGACVLLIFVCLVRKKKKNPNGSK